VRLGPRGGWAVCWRAARDVLAARRAAGHYWSGVRSYGSSGEVETEGSGPNSLAGAESEAGRRQLTRLGRTQRVGRGYWDDVGNQRHLFDRVAEKYGVKTADDWKRVRNKDVAAMGGAPVLARYGSFAEALRGIYPELELDESSCRAQMPRGYWKSLENRKAFVSLLAERMGVKRASDWKRVRYSDVRALPGGRGLLGHYPSLYDALRECWLTEGDKEREGEEFDVFDMRDTVPQGHWESKENVRKFVERLRKELAVEDKEDWYRVSWEQVQKLGGARMLAKKFYLVDALRLAYPNETWDSERFSSTKKRATQRQLYAAISAIVGAQQQ